jgi:uncharacterized protein with PIN domain
VIVDTSALVAILRAEPEAAACAAARVRGSSVVVRQVEVADFALPGVEGQPPIGAGHDRKSCLSRSRKIRKNQIF